MLLKNHYMYQIMLSLCFQIFESSSKVNGEEVLCVANGVTATPGQIPYQVALKNYHVNGLYLTYCGGSIIGDRKILSAAHCFFYKEPSEYCDRLCTPRKKLQLNKLYAVAGTVVNKVHYRLDNSAGGEQWRKITTTYIPNSYKFPKQDIAVAVTSEPFVFGKYVAALPYATRQTDYGAIQCAASGFGRVAVYKKTEFLIWANLTLIPKEQCTEIHRRNMDDFICTESVRTDVMVGDSGGPLVCHNTGDPSEGRSGVIVGVVSGVRQGCGTFFTRVSNYRGFIESLSSCSTRSAAGFCIILLKFIEIVIFFLFYFVKYRRKEIKLF